MVPAFYSWAVGRSHPGKGWLDQAQREDHAMAPCRSHWSATRRLGGALLVVAAGTLLLAALFAAAACRWAGGDELRSDRARSAASASSADVHTLVDGNNTFAFDLYRTLSSADGNLFYSPYSVSLALAMTYAGARGETERQMAETLGFRLPQQALHAAFNTLDLELGARGADDDGFRLRIASAVWGQRDYEFLDDFLDHLAQHYGAGVMSADFQGAPEASRVAINDWVAERTEDRVRDLIPPGLIHSLTRMALVNAVYFDASWALPFPEARTAPGPFHLLDGGSVEAPMMRTNEEFTYASGDGYQAVDLPYDGYELSMTILLPDRGRFQEFEQGLDAELLSRAIADLHPRTVDLSMPRFGFESQFRLAETLKAIGMGDAFDPSRSDFSGIDGRSCAAGDDPCLYVEDVVHQGFVSVDEAGTEAAAATAVLLRNESAGPPPVTVAIDRPFIFLIRDRATGAILFVGRVLVPS